ncbi:MAG: cupin domain-containing protein [Sporichthyaceae bacterium]
MSDERKVGYIRVYTDENNVTRLEDLEYSALPMDLAPPAPPVWVTPPVEASAVMFLSFPAGWSDPAHPAPARQFVIVLSGEGIGIVGDERRPLRAGDVALMEDTTGPGHGLIAVTDLVMAVVRV